MNERGPVEKEMIEIINCLILMSKKEREEFKEILLEQQECLLCSIRRWMKAVITSLGIERPKIYGCIGIEGKICLCHVAYIGVRKYHLDFQVSRISFRCIGREDIISRYFKWSKMFLKFGRKADQSACLSPSIST